MITHANFVGNKSHQTLRYYDFINRHSNYEKAINIWKSKKGQWKQIKPLVLQTNHNSTEWVFELTRVAAFFGRLDVLMWLVNRNYYWDTELYYDAIQGGHLHILKWAREYGCPWVENDNNNDENDGSPKNSRKLFVSTCLGRASESGNELIFKWLVEEQGLELNDFSPNILIEKGNFDILKWVVRKGCDLDESVCEEASRHGHLHMLQWLRNPNSNEDSNRRPDESEDAEHRPDESKDSDRRPDGRDSNRRPCPWDERTCARAAENGHYEILKWCRSQVPPCPWNSSTTEALADNNEFELLQWAYDNGCPLSEWVFDCGSRTGNLEMIQWFRSKGCPWDAQTCSAVAASGNINILQWFRANGCPWNEKTCSAAAQNGHFELLKWARANGCPWNSDTLDEAFGIHRLDIISWCYEQHCPMSEPIIGLIFANQHIDIQPLGLILKWMSSVGLSYDPDECSSYLPTTFHAYCIQRWLQTHANLTLPPDTTKWMDGVDRFVSDIVPCTDLSQLIKTYI